MLSAMVWVRAADSEKPAASKARSSARLTQPWSKMTTLSDEQKSQIREIHSKANQEIKAIHEKETADIMALLSNDQKAEVQKLIDQQTTLRKSGSRAKKQSPTTKTAMLPPAGAAY
jgi:Spy/CpxP family protein refolding chaperone